MSAAPKTSTRVRRIFAPLATNSLSGYPASVPAPASTTTSRPAFARLGTTAGTIATRRSPGKLSRGTPTIMKLPPVLSSRLASPLRYSTAIPFGFVRAAFYIGFVLLFRSRFFAGDEIYFFPRRAILPPGALQDALAVFAHAGVAAEIAGGRFRAQIPLVDVHAN